MTFLGTGTSQGVPVIGCSCKVCTSLDYRDKRLRTSVYVEVDDASLVIDTGPDFRQQMLREGISKLDGVLFTHQHKDHTAGLDDVRSFNFLQKKDMPIYGRPEVIAQLKKEFSYAFEDEKYPGVPRLEVNTIGGEDFFAEGILVTPIEVMHLRLPVYGFRIGGFTYITDANHIAEDQKAKILGSKVLVLNALQKGPHISHFTLEEAIELAREIGAGKTFFTHISHKMGVHHEVEQELPPHMHLAYDGLTLEL